jgi:hypothetical protein
VFMFLRWFLYNVIVAILAVFVVLSIALEHMRSTIPILVIVTTR